MHRPFEKLKGLPLGGSEVEGAMSDKHNPPEIAVPPEIDDEQQLFDWAMQDVTPLPDECRTPRGKALTGSRPDRNGDLEVVRELESLVRGDGPFDLSSTDEYIERAVEPGARPLLRKLRRGQYAVQGMLDLHGMDREEARTAVEAFILQSTSMRRGCVKIIHGRGHNSKENRAILKELLQLWLATRRMSRSVLAYTSARACDGGAGAVYVLLRRPRQQA